MEDKILEFWNLIMKRIMEEEKKIGNMEVRGEEELIKEMAREEMDPRRGAIRKNFHRSFNRPFQADCGIGKTSTRVYTREERIFLSHEAINFLRKLLVSDIIDLEVHEEIIEKVRLYSDGMADMEEVSMIGSMVLSEKGYDDSHQKLMLLLGKNFGQRLN